MPCIIQTPTVAFARSCTINMNLSKHMKICQNGFTMMRTKTYSVQMAQSTNIFQHYSVGFKLVRRINKTIYFLQFLLWTVNADVTNTPNLRVRDEEIEK